MFSEIALERLIKVFVKEIKRDLEANENKPEVCSALRKIGRFALTQFEWSTPNWANEYEMLFSEQEPRK